MRSICQQRPFTNLRQPFCTLPYLLETSVPSGVATRYARMDLPAHITLKIKKAAEEHDLTFSYVVAAAVAMAIYRNSPNRDTARAVLLPAAPIDLRFRLPEYQRQTYVAHGIVAAGSLTVPVSALKVGLFKSGIIFLISRTPVPFNRRLIQ